MYAYIPRGAIDIRLVLLSKLVLALQLKFRQDVLALYLHEVDLLLNEDCAHLTVWES